MDTFLSNIYEYASSPQKLRSVSSSWNTGLLSEEQLIMDSLHVKYPGVRCLYDIMILIAHNNDIDTLRSLLISYRGYLPVNWNRYSYHVKSVDMLRLLLPYLDRETYDIVTRRIRIITYDPNNRIEFIPKPLIKDYLHAILLEKRYDILTDYGYTAQDWIPYVTLINDLIPKEARQWLIERRAIRYDTSIQLYDIITKDNLDKILNPSITVTLSTYTNAQLIDRLMDLLKQYPTDKDMMHHILGFSLMKGYVEILDCYLTKANYIPSLGMSDWPYDEDTKIFLLRNGFSSSMDFLKDLPMNILSGLLATLIAKNNISLYKYVVNRNKANVSILRDKINKYIDKYDGDREQYLL